MTFKKDDPSSSSTENHNTSNKANEPTIQNKSFSHNASTLSVKDFGAIGDGVTDDTNAINNAISFAFNNKRALDFESGIYVYDRPTTLFMDGNFDGRFIDWVGRGAKILFKRLDIAYLSFFKMEYVNIEGITFEGPAAVGDSPNQNAIGLGIYSTKRLYIGNCCFTKFIGDGLFISSEQINSRHNSTQNVLIQNSHFNNNGRGGLTIVGCVSGNIMSNHFGDDRLTIAPVIGDVIHIESDPSTRYGIDSLCISNNLIFGPINLSNCSWQKGWVGDKDTWISFHHNKLVVSDEQYAIISIGGNIKIMDNEIEITRLTPNDDLGSGAIYLKCNSAIIKRNTIKTVGKGTIISIYNWTHDNKGKVIIKENIYITDVCSYVYRFYKDANSTFPNQHNIVKIINENYLGIKLGNWLFSAPQFGGSSLKYYLEGLTWSHSNGIEFKNPNSNEVLYLRDCLVTPSSSLFKWDRIGVTPKIYHENSKLSGFSTVGINPFPLSINASYKINAQGHGEDNKLYNTNIIGRTNTITKIKKGNYQWDSFIKEELYSYNFTAQIILPSAETGIYFLIFKNGLNNNDKLFFEIKDEKNNLVDLPLNTEILIGGIMLNNSAISTLAM
ncbi:glycosyl hydrolase family 28-related protein [Priestia megaterium]|uniref:glycosyl hydrolase family 28-related protein n=1 Tax=Priestia megaterium TaxID=1404 RepID=UPI00234E7F77|nr:glycosyl hydrolase family 28-related protein [Priestia megaterium]MDC7783899.1 glycosyl hydrolase family 28-related protein [Priestia megaterium]